ncbi:hypothetical protein [Proteiniphilum sp.]|uniref:hypothetical protein n=1 Tax=Proteiniphilum sp. TaxID=1926877 RepID=UPI002B20B2BD|nr:hypothetical protein [Proteiniphilum sp.]MEA4916560.1 hypothetical protein [Proteiniphilum sp.]
MKKFFLLLSITVSFFFLFSYGTSKDTKEISGITHIESRKGSNTDQYEGIKNTLPEFSTIVDGHRQIYMSSCIPSSIEMVLKYLGKVDMDFYELQHAWKNKIDGSFRNFDGRTINGVRFDLKFDLPRNAGFPIDSLFTKIDNELDNGKKVIISLVSNTGWHMYVIDKKTPEGEYISYSKNFQQTLKVENTREIVKRMQGTDIMTYSIMEE